jgi:type II restriction enzyme
MAQKDRLRQNRYGTVINLTSKAQDAEIGKAVVEASEVITERFGIALHHRKTIRLAEIIDALELAFPTVDFAEVFPRSAMSPDGGILSIIRADGSGLLPILIAEKKNQGTNDLRAAEGLAKQAMGNAIERLGKNVIGFRTMMLEEGIMPFVCFGDGHDFREESTLVDRVKTIAMFGALNEVNVVNQGEAGQFNRGSFFFRQAQWTKDEMLPIMVDIATRSIHYYLARYGETAFEGVEARP